MQLKQAISISPTTKWLPPVVANPAVQGTLRDKAAQRPDLERWKADTRTTMEQQALISWLALGVSILGFGTSIWSAWVSHRSYKHSKQAHQAELRLAFEKERSELLEVINTSRKLLDKTRLEIAAQKAEFDAQPAEVQALMVNYTSLFTEYLPAIEGGVRQATALWDEVAAWSPDSNLYSLVLHQARFRALLHEDQVAHEGGLYSVGVFREKLGLAKKAVREAQDA